MKTLLGKASFAAAMTCIAPLVSVGQNIASQPGSVNRTIERVTLLPGPHLLSPARATPTMMPSPMKLDGVSPLGFVPAMTPFVYGGQGTVRQIDRTSVSPLSFNGKLREQLKETVRPSPELFRFDSKLEPVTSPKSIQFKFVPKRD